MSIFQVDMLTGLNKIETAIALLRACEPPERYYGAFSGGKDSCVIKHLGFRARLKKKIDWHYCQSPIDPKEIHQFIREFHPDVQWDNHIKKTGLPWWELVAKKGLPRRKSRWCCEIIKEAGGEGRTVIVGSRREESATRRGQKCFQKHTKRDIIYVRPIIDWTEGEVWEYIALNNLPFCSLYKEGLHRLGCVLCPLVRNTKYEIERFPKIARLWRLSCEKIVERRLAKGKDDFKTGEELWHWWLDRDAKKRDSRALKLEL